MLKDMVRARKHDARTRELKQEVQATRTITLLHQARFKGKHPGWLAGGT